MHISHASLSDNYCTYLKYQVGSSTSVQHNVYTLIILVVHRPTYMCMYPSCSTCIFSLQMWQYTFSDVLCVPSEKHPILLTEAYQNPKANREKMTEILFEVFKVPALHAAAQPTLSLFSSGRTTGVVFDSGDTVSRVVPIYDSHAIPDASPPPDTYHTGRDMTYALQKKLSDRYSWVTNDPDTILAIKELKEKCCYVALDFEKEMSAPKESIEKKYTVEPAEAIGPVLVGSERFLCCEQFFEPTDYGIHEAIHNSIQKCDKGIQQQLYANIFLSGGNTMYHGLAERLQKEIQTLSPAAVKVIAPDDAKCAAWLGGSMLASLPTFKDMCVSKQEYQESGPTVIHRKCSNV